MASLYEMAQGPEFDPAESFFAGRTLAFQTNIQKNKLAELARADQARPLIGNALMGDQNAYKSLAGIDPGAYMDVQKHKADVGQSNLKVQQAEYERMHGVLSGADTPEKWNRAIQFLESQGADISPEERDFNNKDFVLAQGAKEAKELGLNPIYGTDANGNTVAYQLSKSGGAVPITLPGGVRLSPGVKTVDTGTGTQVIDSRTGMPVQGAGGASSGVVPKNLAAAETEKNRGKTQGENLDLLNSMQSKLPGLEAVVQKLEGLADQATYTMAGGLYNEASKQLGFGATKGAVARTEYVSTVANQVLPLLRDTFGAAFTAAEGERLLATLGDPDTTPDEKKAVLRTFIDQKKRDIEGLARQTGQPYPGADGITQQDQGGTFEQGANPYASDPSFGQESNGYSIGQSISNPNTGEVLFWDGNDWRAQ